MCYILYVIIYTCNISFPYPTGEKGIKMREKRQKIKCVDCGIKTDDFYPIPNNRGKLYKCKDCYELSLTRSSRNEYSHRDIHYTANSVQR